MAASRPAASAPLTVYIYHGAAKLTLVRETMQDDPPATALADLAGIAASTDQDCSPTSIVSNLSGEQAAIRLA